MRSPFAFLPALTKLAITLGAAELTVVTSFANEQLLGIAVTRYGFITVGGYEIWSIVF
jgi:hypothetical protein